ncbi:hypothetical protein EPA86_08665 [Litorilituus lipolyticus]|uniref:Uncharacterized protein n=1 Tax=Litorilituus lipolyticus TaxID=2491017 RepID=A0A502KVS9_9GAMM|nr:hypothetical protein EPA86_08665 [Litorilituus lipolyticus]
MTSKSFLNNIVAILLTCSLSTNAIAADSAQHTSKAGKHSALATSHGVASTAKVAAAVVAVPVAVSGGAMLGTGVVSAGAGSEKVGSQVALSGAVTMSAAAQAVHSIKYEHKDELIISDITITADPAPQTVMQQNKTETTKTTVTTKTTIKTTEQK